MLHAKIVSHLVSDSRRDQTNDARVVHGDATGEFISAYRSLESLADYAAIESDSPVVEK